LVTSYNNATPQYIRKPVDQLQYINATPHYPRKLGDQLHQSLSVQTDLQICRQPHRSTISWGSIQVCTCAAFSFDRAVGPCRLCGLQCAAVTRHNPGRPTRPRVDALGLFYHLAAAVLQGRSHVAATRLLF
jgi:hypothetical protein